MQLTNNDLLKVLSQCTKVDETTKVYDNRTNSESELDFLLTPEMEEKTYSIKENIIGFVYESEFYTIPYFQFIHHRLIDSGFDKANFSLPLGNEIFPAENKGVWIHQLNNSRIRLESDIIGACLSFSDNHDIKPLDNDFIFDVFQLPFEGLRVEYNSKNYTYLPFVVGNNILDLSRRIPKVGRFNKLNGVTVFIYRDGITYLTTKDYEEALKKAGFVKDKFLSVPLAKGEVILDPLYMADWERLCKKEEC